MYAFMEHKNITDREQEGFQVSWYINGITTVGTGADKWIQHQAYMYISWSLHWHGESVWLGLEGWAISRTVRYKGCSINS